jgi:hypothetical protein
LPERHLDLLKVAAVCSAEFRIGTPIEHDVNCDAFGNSARREIDKLASMPMFNPTTLHHELSLLAAEIREAKHLTELQWEEIEERVSDFIEKLELMAEPIVDQSKNSFPQDYGSPDSNVAKALASVKVASRSVVTRAAGPAAEALGRASLQLRGGGPMTSESDGRSLS